MSLIIVCHKSQVCTCHPNFELLKGAFSTLCLCITSYLEWRTLQHIILKKRDSQAFLLLQVKPKYSNFGLYDKRMKWWKKCNLKLLCSKCEEKGNAKINRMWSRILQSIITFFSAGGGVVEQMCWDFCRQRRKNLEKHKGKAHSTKDILRVDGLRRTLLCHSKYSQAVSRTLPPHVLLFGTRYTVCEEQKAFYAFYPSVYQVHLQSKRKSSLVSNILRIFYLWFWHMTHRLHSDGRFLFSLDISRSSRFYEPYHKLKRYCACKECWTSSQKHLMSSSVKLKDGIFFCCFFFASNIPSELGKLTRSNRTRLA